MGRGYLLDLQIEYEHSGADVRVDVYLRRVYTTLAYCLRKAYGIARECSPLAGRYEFMESEDYWKLIDVGVEAGLL